MLRIFVACGAAGCVRAHYVPGGPPQLGHLCGGGRLHAGLAGLSEAVQPHEVVQQLPVGVRQAGGGGAAGRHAQQQRADVHRQRLHVLGTLDCALEGGAAGGDDGLWR
jgi:hypothetical protein